MLRVLRMVHALHKRGRQRLRVVPFMAPSGCHWRCYIAPMELIDLRHGAWLRADPEVQREELADPPSLVARYTSGQGSAYFGWREAQADTVEQLATRFEQRFADLCARGAGGDWAYAGWYVMLLGAAERGAFPSVCDDWDGLSTQGVRTFGPGKASLLLPLPPATGSAEFSVPTREIP
jgi:hypothetical protein